MTIRLLSTYDGFAPNSIITIDPALETSFIAAGNATADLTGGVVAYRERQPVLIQPAVKKRGTVNLIANRKATVPLTEGSVLTITPTAGTTGTYQRYDASGAPVGALTAIGAAPLTVGAYEGDYTVEIKCTTGSLAAKTTDAVLGSAVTTGSTISAGGRRSVALFGPAAALAQKGLADQMASVRAGLDTYSTSARFVENWLDTTAWAKGAQPFTVSGGKMYAGATQGGGSNGNHSFVSASGAPLCWSIDFFLPTAAGVGSVVMGFDSSAAGATPGAGGSTASWALEFNLAQTTGVRRYLNGTIGGLAGTYPGGGNFTTKFIKDANWLSYCLYNNDTNVEFLSGRVAQAGVTINNLYIANGDPRQLTGAAISPCSARAATQPALAGQAGGAGRFSHYTGSDASGTVNYRIWGPAGYDPRRAWPTVILFHGDGSDENMFAAGSLLVVKDALIAAGYLVMGVAISANKSTWGAQSSIDAYTAAVTYLRANYSVGQIAFLAVSMGGIESLNCLASKKIGGVVAWAGISPTANLASAYARIEFTAKINTAYGITGSGQTTYALATDGYDPLLQTDPHAFQDLPMMFLAATDDTLITRALNTDLLKLKVAATAAEVIDIAGITGQHSFDVSPYAGQIVGFFDKYAKA